MLKVNVVIKKLIENKLFKQLFRFGIVGGLAFIIDYSVMVFSKEILHFYVLIAVAFGFLVSVIFNYWASVTFVFDVKQKRSKTKEFIIFVILSAVGLGITEISMWFGVEVLGINYMIVKIAVAVIVMIFNFVTRKMFLE